MNGHLGQFPADRHAAGKASRITRFLVSTNTFTGFPYATDVRDRFRDLVAAARAGAPPADVRLLCLHHCIEGATCGPGDFTFLHGPDVIPRAELPRDVAAVLSGHIHRHQVLRADSLPPVIYAGSTERTSRAEAGETKGIVILQFDSDGILRHEFRPLPNGALSV